MEYLPQYDPYDGKVPFLSFLFALMYILLTGFINIVKDFA